MRRLTRDPDDRPARSTPTAIVVGRVVFALLIVGGVLWAWQNTDLLIDMVIGPWEMAKTWLVEHRGELMQMGGALLVVVMLYLVITGA